MFEGRFKFRRHHDFRMDAGPIKDTYRSLKPRELDGNYVIAGNLENERLLREEAENHFFEDFHLSIISEEDYQEYENGTISDEKIAYYIDEYSEEYKKYFEKYFEGYFEKYKAKKTASKQTKWQLGGSCFLDRLFDFKSVANTQEVLWGVLFSICAFILSLISWDNLLLLIIFAITILIGYNSLLVRHLNYRGWSKVKGLALPVVSAVVCLVILGNGVSETLNYGGDSFDNLIESILLPTILQDIVLMIYLLLLACIKKQARTNY